MARPLVGAGGRPPGGVGQQGFRPAGSFGPAGSAGQVAAPSKSRRNLLVTLIVAAVVAVAAVVTVIVATSKGGTAGPGPTTSRPSPAGSTGPVTSAESVSRSAVTSPVSGRPIDCKVTPKDESTGMSPCLLAATGTAKADAIRCTDDLSGEEAKAIKQLIDQINPAAFSVCVFSTSGKLMVAVLIHATSDENRDQIFDQERRTIGGTNQTWSQGGLSGSWAPGTLIGSGEPEIDWKFDSLPIVGVLTPTTQDQSKSNVKAAALEQFWRQHLLPQGQ